MNPYSSIIDLLKKNQVAYKELDHEPVYTSEQAANIRGLSLGMGAKSILLKVADSFVLVVLAGDKKLDSKKLKTVLATKKIRFATPEEVKSAMGCEIGACYPFGSVIGLQTLFDSSLESESVISLNPGVHDKSIVIGLEDYLRIEKPRKVEVSV